MVESANGIKDFLDIHLTDVDTKGITKLKILYTLWDRESATLQELIDVCEISRQVMQYHLKQLISEGIVLKYHNVYYIQPVLTETEIVMEQLRPLIQFITEYLDTSQCENKTDAVKNAVMSFLFRLTIELE